MFDYSEFRSLFYRLENSLDEFEQATITLAALKNDLKPIQNVLSSKLNKNPQIDKNGRTLLDLMAELGYFDGYQYVSRLSGEFNPTDSNGRTPLHHASTIGHLQLVKFIGGNVEDPNPVDKTGLTPLVGAVNHGHVEVVRYLLTLQKGTNWMHSQKKTIGPIHLSLRHGNLDIFTLFEPYLPDYVFADKRPEGLTLLHYAVDSNDTSTVKYICDRLDENDAFDKVLEQKHIEDPVLRYNPLHVAIMKDKSLDIIEILVNYIPPDEASNFARKITPLHLAAKNYNVKIFEILSKKATNLLVQAEYDDGPTTPLDIAAINDNYEVVDLILKLVLADPDRYFGNKRKDVFEIMRSPLKISGENGRLNAFTILIQHFLKLNFQTFDIYDTVLEMAKTFHPECKQILKTIPGDLKLQFDPIFNDFSKILTKFYYGIFEEIQDHGNNATFGPLIEKFLTELPDTLKIKSKDLFIKNLDYIKRLIKKHGPKFDLIIWSMLDSTQISNEELEHDEKNQIYKNSVINNLKNEGTIEDENEDVPSNVRVVVFPYDEKQISKFFKAVQEDDEELFIPLVNEVTYIIEQFLNSNSTDVNIVKSTFQSAFARTVSYQENQDLNVKDLLSIVWTIVKTVVFVILIRRFFV